MEILDEEGLKLVASCCLVLNRGISVEEEREADEDEATSAAVADEDGIVAALLSFQ